jgi:ATP-dependent helicase/nuclease subunit B
VVRISLTTRPVGVRQPSDTGVWPQVCGGWTDTAQGGGPVVVTASNTAAVSVRRALAGRPGGIANVTFLTLARLAERLGSASLAAEGRRPMTTPVVAAAVRFVLAEEPGIFASVAGHPATEQALVAAVGEFGACTPEALQAVAISSGQAGGLVRIVEAVRARLAPDWYDEHDLCRVAAARVRGGCSLDGPVYLHLLERVPPAAAELIAAIAGRVEVVASPPLTGAADVDRPVIESHAAAGVPLDPPVGRPLPAATRALSASDPDEEVRAVVRTVLRWAEEGVALARMAVLFTARNPYLRLLHEQLDAAGVRHNGTPLRAVGELLYGRTIRGLLALPEHGMRRGDVMALLAGSQFRDDNGLLPTRAWERIARAATVVGGADWDGRLAGYAQRLRGEADQYEADGQATVAAARRRDAERSDGLRAFVGRLAGQLEGISAAATWDGMVASLKELLEAQLGGERRRVRWPEAEREAADRVDGLLERLASLDALGPAPTLSVFRRTLEGELEAALLRHGHLGDGVFVAQLSAAVGIDVDKVVVVGLAEGMFPARRLEDSLLPDRDRRAAGGQLRLRGEQVFDDRRHLLLALAGTGESVLTYARGDLRRQGDRHPSRWLLDAVPPGADRDEWVKVVPSFSAGLTAAAVQASAQDLRLARIAVHGIAVVEAEDPTLRRNVALASARRSSEFTRFDGNLSGVELPDPAAGAATTATRLESWVRCPQAYFQRYLLGVAPVERPGARLEIDALTRGTLIHEVLERFVAERIVADGAAPWLAADRDRLLEIGGETWDAYAGRGLTGHAVFSARDRTRLLDDLSALAERDDGRPVAVEWAFEDVPYRLADGREVRFRGKVDRIDDVGGVLRVTDYKTGRAESYGRISETVPDGGGTHLQLAVYAAAVARDGKGAGVESRYWFPTDRGGFASIGYPFTADVAAHVARTLATIADGIAAGTFPHHPPDKPAYGYVDCWWCTPDGLSASEMRRAWQRKRADPALAGYLVLVGETIDDAT